MNKIYIILYGYYYETSDVYPEYFLTKEDAQKVIDETDYLRPVKDTTYSEIVEVVLSA